jgi:hypothetical protein
MTAMRRAALVPAGLAALVAVAVVCLGDTAASQRPRFLADAPLARIPDTQDASGVRPWDIHLAYDLTHAYFVTSRRTPENVRAGNVNTIDEVPDSSWFTNRVGSRALTLEDIVRGPNVAPPPDPSSWNVLREKSSGYAAGFTAEDAGGQTWFVSFDAPSNPEGATAAIVVATKLFWALGYNQVENHLTEVRRDRLSISPKATVRRPSGERTPMKADDVEAVMARARPRPDGTYRVAAGLLLPGRILGGFRYEGTRPDDPNDIVDHQHRREIRALRVFGAWTNLTDMKAGNTLDTLVPENGRQVVRHYLQDVGSTFGVGAAGPHDWSEGWEYVIETAPALRRLFSLGLALSPWQTARIDDHPAIGRFEGDRFDPATWRPRAPVRSHGEMRDDDAFWAARRVMAFSDAMIEAAVGTASFSDPAAARLLASILIKRRDAIGRTYLPRISPIVDPALGPSGLVVHNAAVDHGVATAPARYHARWFAFDNATGESRELGVTSSATTTLAPPADALDRAGAYVRVDVGADHEEHRAWATPVETYFRRDPGGWTLVGLTRMKN